jgi:hypothetical protein
MTPTRTTTGFDATLSCSTIGSSCPGCRRVEGGRVGSSPSI